MDIKAKIEEIVEKIKADENFAEDFKKDPVKSVESVTGVDLPDDMVLCFYCNQSTLISQAKKERPFVFHLSYLQKKMRDELIFER